MGTADTVTWTGDEDWSVRLHALWTCATGVGDITGIAPELYPALVDACGVRTVVGYRWTGTRLSYTRRLGRGETRPALHVPDADEARTDWDLPVPPPATEVGEGTRVDLFTRAAYAALARPGGPDVLGPGVLHVAECVFTLPSGDHAAIAVGFAEEVPDHAALVRRLHQVGDVVLAGDERLRLRDWNQRRRLQDAFLAEASLQMDASLDAVETLGRIARLAVPAIADGCLIHLADAEGDPRPHAHAHVSVAAQNHLAEHVAADPWLTALLRRALTGGHALTLDGDRLAGGPLDDGRVTHVSVNPLTARGRALGTLTFLYSRRQPVASAHFLADLADRAALAIDSTLVHAERRRQVRMLQQHLLPSALPRVPGLAFSAEYRVADTSMEVGGDFYDVVESDGATALVIGDVCGRGAEAAALTGLARHTLRTLLEDGTAPEAALARLNRSLTRSAATRFVTAVVAVLTPGPEGHELRVAGAGHPHPVLLRRDGTVRRLPAGGLLLGVAPDVRYEPLTEILRPGDTLYLYTDGLTEARSADGAFFEEVMDGALAAAGPGDPEGAAARLLAAAADYTAAGNDDTAVLTVTVLPR
ncbi:PP2C family protein-serine/threonine phosphatase [Streptomyces sp. BI20]|uniref:PP2C family protein-serine/threonine phosphatase n=1 Tax=Streptomyces sp. BI20 TaxID=3403460 RepID=UPI003C741C7B